MRLSFHIGGDVRYSAAHFPTIRLSTHSVTTGLKEEELNQGSISHDSLECVFIASGLYFPLFSMIK